MANGVPPGLTDLAVSEGLVMRRHSSLQATARDWERLPHLTTEERIRPKRYEAAVKGSIQVSSSWRVRFDVGQCLCPTCSCG